MFNPLGWDVEESVALPVSSAALIVRSATNATVPSTILPTDPARIHQIIQNRESASVSQFTLHFNAAVPAFGFAFFTLSSADPLDEAITAAPTFEAASETLKNAVKEDFLVISNEYLSLSFSHDTKLLAAITDVQRNVTLSCKSQLMYYEAEGHLLADIWHKK